MKRLKNNTDLKSYSCQNQDCIMYNIMNKRNIKVHMRYGKNKDIRLLKCNECGVMFSERINTYLSEVRIDERLVKDILELLANGKSIRKISRLVGVSKNAVLRLKKKLNII